MTTLLLRTLVPALGYHSENSCLIYIYESIYYIPIIPILYIYIRASRKRGISSPTFDGSCCPPPRESQHCKIRRKSDLIYLFFCLLFALSSFVWPPSNVSFAQTRGPRPNAALKWTRVCVGENCLNYATEMFNNLNLWSSCWNLRLHALYIAKILYT